MMTKIDLDEIEWGPKTPHNAGETVLDLSQPLKLWWDDGDILMVSANSWNAQPGPRCTHYAYPEAPPMTKVVGYWGPTYPLEIFSAAVDATHRITIAFPGDDMPEFQVEIHGGGYVKVEKTG